MHKTYNCRDFECGDFEILPIWLSLARLFHWKSGYLVSLLSYILEHTHVRRPMAMQCWHNFIYSTPPPPCPALHKGFDARVQFMTPNSLCSKNTHRTLKHLHISLWSKNTHRTSKHLHISLWSKNTHGILNHLHISLWSKNTHGILNHLHISLRSKFTHGIAWIQNTVEQLKPVGKRH